jgi:hypothetical protein
VYKVESSVTSVTGSVEPLENTGFPQVTVPKKTVTVLSPTVTKLNMKGGKNYGYM